MSEIASSPGRDIVEDVYSGAGPCLPAVPLEEDAETKTSPQPRAEIAGSGRVAAFLTLVLFCLSLAALCVSLGGLFSLGRVSAETFAPLRGLPSAGFERRSAPDATFVASFLSLSAKEALLREAFVIMNRSKDELRNVENLMRGLELDKNTFMNEMERKKARIDGDGSIIEEKDPLDELKTVLHEGRAKAAALREVRRRTDLYLKQYRERKGALQSEADRLRTDVRELTLFTKGVEESGPREAPPELEKFFRGELERRLLGQFHFQLERGDYARAIDTLGRLAATGERSANRTQTDLLERTIRVLMDYGKRVETLKRDSLLGELKMAYLEENYEKALVLSEKADRNGFLLPVLAEFRETLHRNIRLSGDIRGNDGLVANLGALEKKARTFEKNGEYDKALKIYQDLLIFEITPSDREYLVRKIQSIMGEYLRNETKRKENTRAAQLMTDAGRAYREGREKEALDAYRTLILECPNSDYLGDALEQVVRITSSRGL